MIALIRRLKRPSLRRKTITVKFEFNQFGKIFTVEDNFARWIQKLEIIEPVLEPLTKSF